MGQKLFIQLDDPLYDGLRSTKAIGFTGGCYCCGRQLHIEFKNLDGLPNAEVDGELFHVLICDDCEGDVYDLEEDGIENVSYDILFHLQEDLQKKLTSLSEIHEVQTEDRFEILKELYELHEIRLRKLKG